MVHPSDSPIPLETTEHVVVKEVTDEVKVGYYVGQCKWFNDVYGYGFLTVQAGVDKGKDIFVHHSGIRPLNSLYKTLKKGEYINFNIANGDNGLQAVDVTGIGGGTLLCDVLPTVKRTPHTPPPNMIPILEPQEYSHSANVRQTTQTAQTAHDVQRPSRGRGGGTRGTGRPQNRM
jgi:cold shock CspA family protein